MRPMTSSAGAGRGHLMDTQSLVPVVKELWNAWEIHFMILLSLSLQVFLFLFAVLRRRSSSGFLQTVLWLVYLAADSVAVFVLGHLAVRASEPGHELMAFWAPFVLVHLGGQDSITAFAKQDNDLWRRHLLNLALQAGITGYVVAKASWPDARLRKAMELMFLSGFFKYGERVYCLFMGDTATLKRLSKFTLWRRIKGIHYYPSADEDSRLFLRKMQREDRRNFYLADRVKQNSIFEDKDNQKLISAEVLEMMEKGSSARSPSQLINESSTIMKEIIAVDAPLNKARNITVAAHGDLQCLLEGFLSSESHHSAYEYVGASLEYCYRRLYTKEIFRVGPLLHFVTLPSAITASIALALFRAAVKKAEDQLHTSSSSRVDVTVTYALLVGAIALDVSSAATISFRYLSFYFPCLANCIPWWPACCTKQWSQKLCQYNVINTAGMVSIWQWFGKDLDSKDIIREDRTSIKEFILNTLLHFGTGKEWGIASTRGHRALHNWKTIQHPKHETIKSLQDTVRSSADFPTSVLILHIATHICYHFGGTNNSDLDEAVKKHKQASTELSNYIMYLVFKCGVMLTTNSKIVHDSARDEIDKILSPPPKFVEVLLKRYGVKIPHVRPHDFSPLKRKLDRASVMRLIDAFKEPQEQMGEIKIMHQESEEQQEDLTTEIKNQESEEQRDSRIEIENQESTDVDDDNAAAAEHIKKLRMNSKTLESPVLPRAVEVAQELISIKNEAERWELIAKVWAEMLYYIAPRCGGDFHYEHLSTGGEFVTHVLLLMYYLGPFLPPPS